MSRPISLDVRFDKSADWAKSTIIVRESPLKSREINFEFRGAHVPSAPTRGEFAILALLPYAMHQGRPLHCNAPVASDFLENIEECIALWGRWRPDIFKPVAISAAAEIDPTSPRGRRAMLVYSGGVDSTFALHAHKTGLLGRRERDIRGALLVNGFFELKLEHPDWFEAASHSAREILRHYDVELTTVSSTWYDICVHYGMTYSFGFYSALHHFMDEFDCGVFAADEPYEAEVVPWASHSSVNRMMCGRSFPVSYTGSAWSRTEKMNAIAGVPAVQEHIRVCLDNEAGAGRNCGKCEKCIRTKLHFMCAGIGVASALGPTPTPDEVSGVRLRTVLALRYFEDLQRHWDSSRYPELAAAIDHVVRDGRGKFGQSTARTFFRKPTRIERLYRAVGLRRR